jgi:prepilin-type N-terminal cleavage/methylation domain-containing protein/prepilin-type processing-associated H-X9-DG protein
MVPWIDVMIISPVSRTSALARRARRKGFTLIELLVVIAIIAILSAILLPALARAKERAQAILCLNNTKQLTLGWQLYGDDFDGVLPYNLVMTAGGFRTNLNWVNNVMTWTVSQPQDSDNTNPATLTEASLGPFVSQATAIYHCPSDHALSSAQSDAGWDRRNRSYSMNAMVGNAGDFSASGFNINNPDYVQFFKITQIPRPSEIFIFLDEHPNTINDGYFLNKAPAYTGSVYGGSGYSHAEWRDLPATYHNNATTFSFADGHSTLHRWLVPSTIYPVRPEVPYIPIDVTAQRADFNWILDHMSVDQN